MNEKINRVEIKHRGIEGDSYLIYEDIKDNFTTKFKTPKFLEDDEVTICLDNESKQVFNFKELCLAEQNEAYDILQKAGVSFECSELEPVEIDFEDATEKDMFNFAPIKGSLLGDRDHGIWAAHGLRKIKFYLKNLDSEITENLDKEIKTSFLLTFNKKDNEILEEPIKFEEFFVQDSCGEEKSSANNEEFFTYIDTNLLGEKIEKDKNRAQFLGNIEVTYMWESKAGYSEKHILPIKIIVQNTEHDLDSNIKCAILRDEYVSIDFGTSSTCVAVRDGKETSLLTISSEEDSENDGENKFENPTNIMLYRWSDVYKQWRHENESFPIFLKGTRMEEKLKEKPVGLDFGYTVKDVLEDAESIELNAIMTQIKLIPYYLEQGEQIEINPLIRDGKTEVVKLVNSPDQEDETSLDPIALYGYLLGRVINNPEKNKIYTKFDISYPVKFNKVVREKIKKSLEYGLRRSLPLSLREAKNSRGKSLLEVNMKYSEPVAYIGAICGKYLKITENKGQLFAVYDFGGGTLDFSFGMFRPDEEEDDGVVIDIYGVGGNEKIGGESLISLISYWIYTDDTNKGNMASNRIPFEKPAEERYPDNLPEKLLNKTNIAKANMKKISEKISRKLFENKNSNIADFEEDIELWNEDNEAVEWKININTSFLKQKLEEKIEETIKNFKSEMELCFERKIEEIKKYSDEYKLENINIFKSGNASKSTIVEEKMQQYFENNRIELIEELENEKKYAITPKTAVAFGQLKLRNFTVNLDEDAPFKWYVLKENKGDSSLTTKITRNQKCEDWINYGVIRNGSIDICYSDSPVSENTEKYYSETITTIEDYEKADFYIRVADETSIEYCVCLKGETPDEKKCQTNIFRLQAK